MRIVYDRRYNLGFPGAQRLHPFDLRKFARAWKLLKSGLGHRLDSLHVAVPAPVTDEELLLAHTPEYLKSLRQSAVVAQAIEVPALRSAPWWLLDRFVLQPMRWATAGTVIAGRIALDDGLAYNLGGGFHHAKATVGEGFSIYNDIAILIRALRAEGRLPVDGRIAYVDLDAHQGNRVAWCFREDPSVFLFDMYNDSIYPLWDLRARERVDCLIPLPPNCSGPYYLERLQTELPPFLDSIGRSTPLAMMIYNAGTDVLADDVLGGLSLTLEDVLERDRFVLSAARERKIPTVVLTSGGYSDQSFLAIGQSVLATLHEGTE